MKANTLLFISLLFTLFLSAQNEYFINNNGDKVAKGDALYKRTVEKVERKLWKVTDFYLDGTLQMTGYYNNKNLSTRKDTFTWYHINGRIDQQYAYEMKKENGKYVEYYFNGNKESIGEYKDGEMHGKWLEWNFVGQLVSEKEYNNGNPVNTWVWYDSTGIEEYRIEDATETKVNASFKIANLKNKMTFQQYYATIKYPEDVINEDVAGYTLLDFKIDTNGLVEDIGLIIPADIRLNTAAINHTKNMPECIPTIRFDKKTETYFIIPLNFTLNKIAHTLTNRDKGDYCYDSGLKAAQTGDTKKAINRIMHAKNYKPTDLNINYLLGSLYYKSNNLPDACKYWTLTYTLDQEKLTDEQKCVCEIKTCISE